jgi:ADP-ribose pyrophosphatase YjhB (NUDIX family)
VLHVQRRDNGHWKPLGCGLELDEAIVDGVRREVREETGLDVEVEALTGVYKNMRRGVITSCSAATPPAALSIPPMRPVTSSGQTRTRAGPAVLRGCRGGQALSAARAHRASASCHGRSAWVRFSRSRPVSAP